MSERALFSLLAEYNQAMNGKLYDAAGQLSAEQLNEDKGAFFGSLMGTMNHIVAGDTIWLQRFCTHPTSFRALLPVRQMLAPGGLRATFSTDLAALSVQRSKLDAVIVDWVAELANGDLEHVLHYKNTKGVPSQKRFSSVVLHFFNHQTHHRGQASTLLSQAGVDLGVTDLLAWIPNEALRSNDLLPAS